MTTNLFSATRPPWPAEEAEETVRSVGTEELVSDFCGVGPLSEEDMLTTSLKGLLK